MSPTKQTTWWQKLLASAIELIIFLGCALPLVLAGAPRQTIITFIVGLCFTYTLASFYVSNGRCVGMILVGSYWQRVYTPWQWIIYSALYTASLATVFYWIWFPFDLLLINLFVLQLPAVLLTKTTLHGLLAGHLITETLTE